MGGLERDELTEQLVVLGVADLRGVLFVIEPVRPVDLRGEVGVARRRRIRVECSGRVDEGWVDGGQSDGHRPEGTEPA